MAQPVETTTILNALWDEHPIKVVGQTVQKLERKQTNKRTDGRTLPNVLSHSIKTVKI